MAPTPAGTASPAALAPAARELMEVLWTAPRPLTTRTVHDAVATVTPRGPGERSRPPRRC